MDNALAAERVQKQVGWPLRDARKVAQAVRGRPFGRHYTIETIDDVGTLGHTRPPATYTTLSEIKR